MYINSTNYEDGDDRFDQVLNLALDYGSGLVIGTIDAVSYTHLTLPTSDLV